jgi:hypothetical protein
VPAPARERTEPAPIPAVSLDLSGDDVPWRRAAWMAAGLGGGQAWREPVAAQAPPLRLVRGADPAGATEVEVPVEIAVRAEPAQPVVLAEAESVVEAPTPAGLPLRDVPVPDGASSGAPARELPAVVPVEGEPAPATDRPEPAPVAEEAVPEQFAGEPAEPPPWRDRMTPDERAAEQAAADLGLLRTFGFADLGQRPGTAPVVAMERTHEQEAPAVAGEAQPVRFRIVRRDGTTVGGAAVTLLDDRGGDVADGAADAEGRGEVLAPAPGGYVLVSTAAGYLPGAVTITVLGAPVDADVLLARSASVSGVVRGEGGPIADARVMLVQDGEAVDAVDTDDDGGYRITDIGPGEYGLSVAAAGCEPVATLIDVSEEADVRHDVTLPPVMPVADDDLAVDDAMSGRR